MPRGILWDLSRSASANVCFSFWSISPTLLVGRWGTESGAGRHGDHTHSPDSPPRTGLFRPSSSPCWETWSTPPQLHPSLSPDPSPGTLPPYFFSTPDPPPPPTAEPGCAFLTLKLRHLGLLLLQRVPQGHLDQRGGSEPGLLCLGAGPVPEPWDQRHFPFISPPTLPLPLSLLP